MENWIARLIAFGLGIIGVAFLAAYPYNRVSMAREKSDLDRAQAPVFSVPLERLQAPGGRTFDVTIPTDKQWKRIAERFGRPTFLLVAASAQGETRRHRFPPADVGLSCRVLRNGDEVALQVTPELPSGYSVGAATGGLSFGADQGDHLTITASIRSATVPTGTVFLLAPRWSRPIVSDEDWAIGAAFRDFLAFASVVVGLVFVLWALTIAWGRPEPARD